MNDFRNKIKNNDKTKRVYKTVVIEKLNSFLRKYILLLEKLLIFFVQNFIHFVV